MWGIGWAVNMRAIRAYVTIGLDIELEPKPKPKEPLYSTDLLLGGYKPGMAQAHLTSLYNHYLVDNKVPYKPYKQPHFVYVSKAMFNALRQEYGALKYYTDKPITTANPAMLFKGAYLYADPILTGWEVTFA